MDAPDQPEHGSTLTLLGDDKKQIPPRPKVPESVQDEVKKWWKRTNDVPDFKAAARAATECQKTLFPALFDLEDPHRGKISAELKTRRDDRRVRVNYAYRAVLQSVATLVPDDHEATWEPIPQVGDDAQKPEDHFTRFCDTVKAEVDKHLDEVGGQEVIKNYIQDAVSFRLACVMTTFDASYLDSPVTDMEDDRDNQQKVQRLRVLVEDHVRGVFTKSDARYAEMSALQETLEIEGDLETWAGIELTGIPIDCVRFCSSVQDFAKIYRSPWICYDALLLPDEIRQKFPYHLNSDNTFSGIHPADMGKISDGQQATDMTYGDTYWTNQARSRGRAANPEPVSTEEAHKHVVRTVWSRATGQVIVLVEGLPYPASRWTPRKQSSNWYPFRFFRFNRVQGTAYGYSDVEMVKDIQSRMNRKKSDEEKARWLHLARYVYDAAMQDDGEMNNLMDIDPGTIKGIVLGGIAEGKKIEDILIKVSMDYDPECFSTEKDEQDFQQMMGQSDQSQGATGQAKFAAEVKSADAGTATLSKSRLTDARNELQGLYHQIAELLVQELTPEQVKEDCGPNALWPHVFSQAEGRRIHEAIKAEADQTLKLQEATAAAQATAIGQTPPQASPEERQSALDAMVQQKCLEEFGFPEPMTREALFRRMRCRVIVGMNVAADQAAQAQSMLALFEAINQGGQAAQAAGKTFDIAPLMKTWGTPEWSGIFSENPAQTASNLIKQAQSNTAGIPPQLAAQVVAILQPIVQQAQAAEQAAMVQKSVQSQITHGVAHAIVHGDPNQAASAPGAPAASQIQQTPVGQEPPGIQPGV